MSVDNLAVETLLNHNCIGATLNEVSDLYRGFNHSDGGPSQEAIEFFNTYKDKMVKVVGARRMGVVVKLNESTRGLYPGSRYPIYVNFPETGNTFEYELESLEVVG